MPKRGLRKFANPKSRKKPSRQEAKRRYISVKNRISNSIVGHQGIYCSYHVHEENMTWIDVSFLSKFHKHHYFSVALTTLEYDALWQDEHKASKLGDAMYPEAKIDLVTLPHSPFAVSIPVDIVTNEDWDLKKEYEDALQKEFNAQPRMMKPNWQIDLDYWYPAIGLHASLNTPSLTEEVIVQFIKDFQALGEPITPGLVWEGEEVEVVPARLTERYAQSRGDQYAAHIA